MSSTIGIQYPRSRISYHIHFNNKHTWVGEELWALPFPMPLSLAMHANIICPRPLSTAFLPFRFALSYPAAGAPTVLVVAGTAFPFPFFLFKRPTLLPFALEVEASPTNIFGPDLRVVVLYWTRHMN
ncbi:UNVERIFIED_CONTAM: hypothetical protein Sradi_5096400 [Sesamum radiatum]|uniref:Uncharacterized protein n=1 Tax=Sesamum radiatum TaxID=300843 RepID=A0AAW2M5M1_SESRA